MIERKHRRYGKLVFDRDAIVRAALRAYVEALVGDFPLSGVSFRACAVPRWTGDLQRGAFCNDDQEGNYDVVGWTEAGVVGLGYELGFGPIEHLDLPIDAVTGGPDDVRAALPGLPDALEPALVLAAGMLEAGQDHGERLAGVGFWLHGDCVEGTLFDDPIGPGARPLAMWGLLRGGRLLSTLSLSPHPHNRAALAEAARREAPTHALLDAVVDRRLRGPTEFTTAEIEALFHPLTTPPPKRALNVQRMLRQVGITWPGSPAIPEPPPRPQGRNPFFPPPTQVCRYAPPFGTLFFDRDPLVRAALRAYVEAVLSHLDPLQRHELTACVVPGWTGDLKRGAFFNGNGRGDYDVVAWTEAGVVGLTYKLGSGPLERLGLSASRVTGGPDDVRAALPELPAALESALEMAVGMLEVGAHGEKLASVGFWLHGAERVAGTLFDDDPTAPGVRRLAAWGRSERKLLPVYDPENAPRRTQATFDRAEPIHDLVDAVTERAFAGPTELTKDELATLLPTPPDPERLLGAQRMLQQVGITWPGSPPIPEPPPRTGRNPFFRDP